MEQVDEETADVRPVVVLVGHDEDATVAQTGEVLVDLARLETEDLLQLCNFLGEFDLGGAGILDVHDFPPQWEHAESLALSLRKTAESHCFCGIALGKDEGAAGGVGGGAGPSSVLKFWDAIDFAVLLSIRLFVILIVLFFLRYDERIHEFQLALDLLQRLLGQLARRPERRRFRGQRLLGLRVEGRVLDLRRHKDREVLAHHRRFHLDLLLGLEVVHDVRDDLVGNVVDVGAALGGPDAVDEGDLEVPVDGRVGDDDAPALVGVGDGGRAHELGGVDGEVLALDERAVPVYLDLLSDRHREIGRAATEETLHARADGFQTKAREVGRPGDGDVRFHFRGGNLGRVDHSHVGLPGLRVLFRGFRIDGFHGHRLAKDVGEFDAVPVLAAHQFLLLLVVV